MALAEARARALVPLFTVGAFAAFTLSQAGMARHWWRRREGGWHWRMVVNAFGASVTTVVLCIVVISKFTHGAWIVVVVLPIVVAILHSLGVHHDWLVRHLRVSSASAVAHFLQRPIRHHAVITVGRVDRAVLQAVAYARGLEAEIEAVYITDNLSQGEDLRERWEELRVGIRLVVLESPIRSHSQALLRYLDLIQKSEDKNCFATVILPEVQPTRWWHPLVHNYFAWRLKWILLFRPKTAVTSVPYEVRD